MNKNVFVVGGAGYIGSHTTLALQEAGFTAVVYGNFPSVTVTPVLETI